MAGDAGEGESVSITELAAAEKIDRSYLCRVLRLTLLGPKMVRAILDGRQPGVRDLPALMKGLTVEWEMQRRLCARAERDMRASFSRSPELAASRGNSTSDVFFYSNISRVGARAAA